MNIRFWGVRGSLGTPLTNAELSNKLKETLQAWIHSGNLKEEEIEPFLATLPPFLRLTAGGDTTCVEVEVGGKNIILDAGTGIRPLGLNLMGRMKGKKIEAHIFISHTHWDHICGFPFFIPAFIPGNKIQIYGVHPNLEKRFTHQQDFIYFPVPLKAMSAEIGFTQLEYEDSFQIGEVKVSVFPLNHPGGSYSYRIEYDNKILVFATDSEYKDPSFDSMTPFMEFYKNADVLIFDAQYSLVENIEKEDWGHSNAYIGIDIALAANVKKIIFTHHEPTNTDKKLWDILSKAQEFLEAYQAQDDLKLELAYQGLTITI